jgi:general secretion pathway protein E
MNARLPTTAAAEDVPPVSLTDAQWTDIRARSVETGRPSIEIACELIDAEPACVALMLAKRLGWDVLDLAQMRRSTPALERVSLVDAQRHEAVLTLDERGDWLGVVCDPFNRDAQVWLETCAGHVVRWCLAVPADFRAYLHQLEESVRAVDSIAKSEGEGGAERGMPEELSLAQVDASESPAVKLVRSTLYDGLKAAASDIHLEATAQGLSIKYRLDGVLEPIASVTGSELAQQVISRLKVLAGLDIAERRIPQDGSFRAHAARGDIDLRISVMPSVHGEDAVIRLLDKRSIWGDDNAPSLGALGFDGDNLATLRRLLEAPHGLLLVTGPTGSGKTTTLYGALSELHNGRGKIITIEDPVEYHLAGVLQIPVHDKKGLSFARGLRSILRHDPDTIMVGEIRDRDTAEIAVQAALTGHLVLSTVHANSVFDVFGRFTHMGLDPYAFASALDGLWAQRLVRLNCPHCRHRVRPDAHLLGRLGLDETQADAGDWQCGAGCGECRGTGYKGRRAIAEVLRLTDDLREMVARRESLAEIRRVARAAGLLSLRDAAIALARCGTTTLDEVRRVTHDA